MPAARALTFLMPLLDARELVIAPSARSAQALRHAFDDHQRHAGRRAWEPARVLSWTQWTASLFAELVVTGREERLLLNPLQELSLWSTVLAADDEIRGLGITGDALDDLAELARSGFSLAAAHDVLDRLRPSAATRDERIFARWADTMRRACDRRGYLPAALLDAALAGHARAGALDANPHLPRTLHLFDPPDSPDPSQHLLLAALRDRGIALEVHTLPALDDDPHHGWLRCETEPSELRFAARWLRHWLQNRRDAHRDRPVQAALVVPGLDAERTAIEAALRDELAPELHAIAADLSSTPWAFSTGAPLAAVPLVACALELARWSAGPLPLANVSALLLSPYTAGALQRDAAAVFDAEVVRRARLLEPELSLASLLTLARAAAGSSTRPTPPPPAWLAELAAASQRVALQKSRTHAEWMEALRTLLDAAGWPGPRALTAAELAATQAFDAALDSLATLDALATERERRLSFPAALRILDRQLRRLREHAAAPDALVQVLAPHELAGLSFDAVVFLRATDAHWPAPAAPHPLLNRTLQREARMRGAHPELAAEQSRETLRNLLDRTPTVFFTCAQENADGALRPSTLLAALNLPEWTQTQLLPAPAELPPLVLDEAPDATPLPPLPATLLRGGSHVIKLQAACGFRAFAELRLRSAEPEDREGGLEPRERGTLVHRILEAFWREVQSQDELRAMTPAQRTATLERAIDLQLGRTPPESSPWSAAYLDLERRRTLHLLEHWLDFELKRAPFRILETEVECDAAVGPLTLKLRMDRVEELPGGGLVLVDYKTAEAKPKAWDGDRPDEPQLPLYACLAEPEDLRAVLFANVRAGDQAGWYGLQSETGVFSSRKQTVTDLTARAAQWRDVLAALATDFAAGRAAVSPKSDALCDRCAQRLLCRRDAAALRQDLRLDDAPGDAGFGPAPDALGGWDD